MMVTVATKDVGEVKDVYSYINYKRTCEDMIEDYIKKELEING